MSPNKHPLLLDIFSSLRRLFTIQGVHRILALISLTMRDAIRSKALLGLTALMALFGAATLLWPCDNDGERVILVQRYCFGALTFFSILAGVFLAALSLTSDVNSKRIYAIMTKPVSRLELLLGKTFGLLGILLIFLLFGGLITLGASHIASARRTYPGGSYLVEVTAPAAAVKTADASIPIEQGEVFPIDDETSDSYQVTVVKRLSTTSGTLPKADGRLQVRSLRLQRIAQPTLTYAIGKGTALVKENELRLIAPAELAENDLWQFTLPETLPPGDIIHIRLQFPRVQFEPPLLSRNENRTATVHLRFTNPANQQTAEETLRCAYRAPRGESFVPGYYEEVIDLPRRLVDGSQLNISILDLSPSYPRGGTIYFTSDKLPAWQFRDIDPALLPPGLVAIQMKFGVQYTRGMELIDTVNLTCEIRNPATGETITRPLMLRNLTNLIVRFPRRLVDDQQGVDMRITTMEATHRLSTLVKDIPVRLILTPDAFWASTARSVLLIFLYVGIFVTFAVAASTFLSAPVAILFVLVMLGVAGLAKDMILKNIIYAPANPFMSQGTDVQQNAVAWIPYLASQLLHLVPAPGDYSSSNFIQHGWSVPWSTVLPAALMGITYAVAFIAIGFLAFRKKEME